MKNPNKFVVIVAGGTGRRAGGEIPKQFQRLLGYPMLWWSLKAFHDENDLNRLIVVLHPDFFDQWKTLQDDLLPEEHIPHEVVAGGRTRCESVFNGIMAIPEGEKGYVAIHDAARPLVNEELIRRGWISVESNGLGSIPVVSLSDSIRKITIDGTTAVDRNDFVAVQTPQIFPVELIREAYMKADCLSSTFTDDASVAEFFGHKIQLFEGDDENFKVTHPFDFEIAKLLLAKRK